MGSEFIGCSPLSSSSSSFLTLGKSLHLPGAVVFSSINQNLPQVSISQSVLCGKHILCEVQLEKAFVLALNWTPYSNNDFLVSFIH